MRTNARNNNGADLTCGPQPEASATGFAQGDGDYNTVINAHGPTCEKHPCQGETDFGPYAAPESVKDKKAAEAEGKKPAAFAQWDEDKCTKTGINPCPDCKPNDCRNPCYKPPPNTPACTPVEKSSAETAGAPEPEPAAAKPAAPAAKKPAFTQLSN